MVTPTVPPARPVTLAAEDRPLLPRIVRTLSKPAGLPVFPPHDDPDGDCLLARLLAEEPERARLSWPRGFEGGIAHRLDNGTSGAVAVADDPDDLAALRALFAEGRLVKRYRLLASRDPGWDRHATDAPIAHDPRRRGRMVVQRGQHTPHRGRWLPARTAFSRVRDRLFEAEMRTGVMHQIRVHAAFLGIAILGDRQYGGGAPPPSAPPGTSFFLHHLGFASDALGTALVPEPPWARDLDPS